MRKDASIFRRGFTLLECMVAVMLLMFLTVAFMRGMIVLRNMQVRSETTARLTDAATQALEEWKAMHASDREEGKIEITSPRLMEKDSVTLEAVRDASEGVWRVTVAAENHDPRQPVRFSFTTEALP